jgi:hypothetical protein
VPLWLKNCFKGGSNGQRLGFHNLSHISSNRLRRAMFDCIAEEFLTTEVRRSTEGPRSLLLAMSNSVSLCASVVKKGFYRGPNLLGQSEKQHFYQGGTEAGGGSKHGIGLDSPRSFLRVGVVQKKTRRSETTVA